MEMGCFLQKAAVGMLERLCTPPFPAGWAGVDTMLSSADGHSVAGPAPSATSAWGLLHPLPTHSCCLSARPRGWSGCLFSPSLNPAAGFVGGYSESETILSELFPETAAMMLFPSPTTFPGTECALHPL